MSWSVCRRLSMTKHMCAPFDSTPLLTVATVTSHRRAIAMAGRVDGICCRGKWRLFKIFMPAGQRSS